MSPLIKALLAGLPFVVAILVGTMFLQPAIDDMNAKSNQVQEKTTEKEGLETKLAGEQKVNAKKANLEKDIADLRSSVPKQPDLDLFTIDLEKMCADAGVDLISITPPKETPGSSSGPSFAEQGGASAKLKAKQEKVKSLLKGDIPEDKSGTTAKKGSEEGVPRSDLEEISRQVVVTGSFHGLRKLVHKLETYQRVIKISQLLERIPKKPTDGKSSLPDESEPSEQTDLGDPKQLYVSMKITAYYLP